MTRTPLGTASSFGTQLTFSNITLVPTDILVIMFAGNWTGVGADPKIFVQWGTHSTQVTLHQSGIDPQSAVLCFPTLSEGLEVSGTNDLILRRTSGASLDNFVAIVSKFARNSNTTAPEDYVEGNPGDNFVTSNWLADTPVNTLTRSTVQAHEALVGLYMDLRADSITAPFPTWNGAFSTVMLTSGQQVTSANGGHILRLYEGYAETEVILTNTATIAVEDTSSVLPVSDVTFTLTFATYKLGPNVSLGGYTSYDLNRFDIGDPEAQILPEQAKKIAQGDLRFVPGRS